MKMFLYGDTGSNCGPSNVNKAIADAGDADLLHFRHRNKFLKGLEFSYNILKSDCIIFSGAPSIFKQNAVKYMNRKAKRLYLMHGCVEYENRINVQEIPESSLNAEKKMLQEVDRIVCVSERYAQWVAERYPCYSDKICFINNPMPFDPQPICTKKPFTVALSGGNRSIKNNKEVCYAIEQLNAEGFNCAVYLFGDQYRNNDDIFDYPFLHYMGQCDREDYYRHLNEISTFIMNSELESFGLALGDALNCNCSILISDHVGAGSLLQLQETDRIHDPHNVSELTEKIRHIFREPNAERIRNSFDQDACSGSAVYKKLKKICREI